MDVATGAVVTVGITQVSALLALVAKEWVQSRRESKDRVALRAHVAKVIDTNAELTTQVQTHVGGQDHIAAMIAENTKISTDAFEEANHAKQLLTEEIAARNDLIKRLQGSQNRRRETDPQILELQRRVTNLEAFLGPLPPDPQTGP